MNDEIRGAAGRGWLVAFEGTDGAGKTTQARRAVETLQAAGREAIYLREPTDGPHGRRLRELMVAGRDETDPREEFRLFLEDRREDLELNIRPALARGAVVCIDRYYISSMAYQGALGAPGLTPDFIRAENEKFAPQPDLVLYLRLPVDEGIARIAAARSGGQNLFERRDYQERVLAVFDAMDFPQMVRIDAGAGLDAVHRRVMEELARLM
jgi:dTMP kinase